MSYHLDLDEYDEVTLQEELRRRKRLQDQGLCDYCEREPDTRNCKFSERHHWNIQHNVERRLLLELLPFYDVECLSNITQAGGCCINFQQFRMVRREGPRLKQGQYIFSVENCTAITNLKFSEDKVCISFTLETDPTL